MARRRLPARRSRMLEKPIFWLPVDSRVFPHIFSFGRVKGIARLFLQIEMVLSVGVVVGTLVVATLTFFR